MILPGEAPVPLFTTDTGPREAPALVFAHALGADLTMWDALLPQLPDGLRVIRMDMRGHGQSPCPPAEQGDAYPMGHLVRDVAATLDRLGVRDCTFVGISIGGIIAQGLAAERKDLVRALVLSNTAVKIGTPALWDARMEEVRRGGIAAVIGQNMQRWFARSTHRDHPELVLRAAEVMQATPLAGYLGCMGAIAETDLYESTARLTLPTLVTAGSEDGSTPADLVRELADLIPGADFRLIRRSGHMPPIEQPEAYAKALVDFLHITKHI
ncbi:MULTISPECIES: 3-oxoadipate enol-lactonase [unclassified Aliiroseovarius]|uniref:3-oxoadipate enol-lactonase n=1 Tax=unclassified Aliiroseovarius TaxID=2623558 RepID=UPI00156878A0|nr:MULTISPECIES: 3-oxoadipate enol-lactonase [unclassified Aliiroseovarius]NRP13926.1 3-oxoadipate enol-lactonase 2 [Aliiroseovarius sp. xm-d-517]NRP41813.1 3-oxoadipate enol-lactonase 2 [Aliiroseovarius sp. xm-m-339-2]NRP62819.1 3-oxoadipate enol-lactonase 2 [Aliiroseovarius sp. xm-a-151]